MDQPIPKMITLLLRFCRDRFLSRWTVLFFDVIATLLALVAGNAFRFNFSVDQAQRVLVLPLFVAVLLLYVLAYIFVGSHKGVLRHTSLDDVKKILKSTTRGFALAMIGSRAICGEKIGRNPGIMTKNALQQEQKANKM